MIRSLRLRLLVYASTASALILALLGITLYILVRQSVISNFDQALLSEARAVAATAEEHGNEIVFDYAPDELPKFVTKDHPDYFQAWIDSGVIIRSPSLGTGDLPRPDQANNVSFANFRLPDGRRGRIVTMSFVTTIESNAGKDSADAGKDADKDADAAKDKNPAGPEHTSTILLSVATGSGGMLELLEGLQWILFLSCGLAVVLSGAVLLWVTARAVRPVERLARDIEKLRENDLSVRLASPDAPTELQPVVDKLNGLLARIAAAFSREKAFTADVAHELRTPLAALITTFDVCRSRPRDEAGYMAAIDKCRDVSHRMQMMIESLLILARADGGQLGLERQSIDAGDLIDECWAMFSPQAEASHLKLEWNVPNPLTIQTDPEKLRIILHNLFDNACSYTNAGGTIRVVAKVWDTHFHLEVANTGSRITPANASHVFERFWRGDGARSDTGIHSGLGLSLCQRLSRLLDGQIDIDLSTSDWFVVRLSLPAYPAIPTSAPTSSPPAAPALSQAPAPISSAR